MEEWRAIPGYEGYYEVSDEGRVRSVDRVIIDSLDRRRRLKSKVLQVTLNDAKEKGTGYYMVSLSIACAID